MTLREWQNITNWLSCKFLGGISFRADARSHSQPAKREMPGYEAIASSQPLCHVPQQSPFHHGRIIQKAKRHQPSKTRRLWRKRYSPFWTPRLTLAPSLADKRDTKPSIPKVSAFTETLSWFGEWMVKSHCRLLAWSFIRKATHPWMRWLRIRSGTNEYTKTRINLTLRLAASISEYHLWFWKCFVWEIKAGSSG